MKVANVLTSNETLNYTASINKNIYIKDVLMIPLFVGIFSLLYHWIMFKTEELIVTSQRLLWKRGLVGYKLEEIQLDKINNCNVNCSFWGRMFNFGTVTIEVSNRTAISMCVNSPIEFKTALDNAIASRREI